MPLCLVQALRPARTSFSSTYIYIRAIPVLSACTTNTINENGCFAIKQAGGVRLSPPPGKPSAQHSPDGVVSPEPHPRRDRAVLAGLLRQLLLQ